MSLGDCFSAALNLYAELILDAKVPESRVALVHAIVTGTAGDVEGKQFVHAWVEFSDPTNGQTFVLDFSNGHRVMVDAPVYYSVGQVAEIVRYDRLDAVKMSLKTGHYGPWDEDLIRIENESLGEEESCTQSKTSST